MLPFGLSAERSIIWAKECLEKIFFAVLIELISAVSHDLAMFSNESPQEFNEMWVSAIAYDLLKSLPWTDENDGDYERMGLQCFKLEASDSWRPTEV